MALRDQPYLPLYIQDFLTDEKLNECSAAATGVYIRIMCLLHKSETYGKILLKQKHKQTSKPKENFALMIAKFLPYDLPTVLSAIEELVEENVLIIEGDSLYQKRMVKDNEISEKRALAGKNGGKKTQDNNKNFAKAKVEANSEYEIDNENEIEKRIGVKGEGDELTQPEIKASIEYVYYAKQILLTPEQVIEFFKGFQIRHQNTLHQDRHDKINHFRDWLKNQKHAAHRQTTSKLGNKSGGFGLITEALEGIK